MNKKNSKSRSGTVLICVLACLGVVIALVMSTVQSSLRGRREVRLQRQLVQTELLCEAGVQRAVKKLTISPDYNGEKWMPKLGITSFDFVLIEIRTKASSDDPKSLRVEVIATLATSTESNDSMQRSHTFTIDATTLSATETKP